MLMKIFRIGERSEWDGRIWRLAGPIIISNLSVPMLGAVDTAVMGHLPDPAYLGAVAVGAMIFSFLYWGFGFLRMSTTGLTAQAFGAERPTEVQTTLARSLLIGTIAAAILICLQIPIGRVAFWAVDASAQVEDLAGRYFSVRIWGAPAALCNYALLGWFLGLQDARRPLFIQLLTNGLNIVLDLFFVVSLGWGVSGVAAATVIAEYSGLAVGLFMAARIVFRQGGLLVRMSEVFDGGHLKRLFSVNRDIFIRTLCLISAFAIFTAKGAKLGEITLAANAVLMNFLYIASYGLDGFAHAAEVLVGGAVGKRTKGEFAAAVRASFRWAAITAGGVVLAFLIVGHWIVNAFSSIPEVREAAYSYLPWVALMPAVSVWCFTYDGIFLGATRTAALRNGMVVSFLGYFAGVTLLPVYFGNHGLWAGLMIFMALRGLTLGMQYPALARAVEA